MSCEPDSASLEMEELMESKGLPEEDRDEVRRFSEFLRLRKNKETSKIHPDMKNWLLGKS